MSISGIKFKQNLADFSQKLARKPAFIFIAKLFKEFPKAEIFLVGGVVRDVILGRGIKDYDLVVRGVGPRDLQKFLARFGAVNLVGKNFGVFKFRPKGTDLEIDVALPRTEHSSAARGGYRDFKIQSDAKLVIEKDLARRDFTINAMAWDLKKKDLVDPSNGLKDLEKKLIRTVGQPQERFSEDYSRLLRAIRFSGQLNFNVEKETFKILKRLVKNLNEKRKGERVVPYEVIGSEILKTFQAAPARALDLLDEAGIFKVLMPEILPMKGCLQPDNWHTEGDVWQHTRLALDLLSSIKFRKKFSNQSADIELIMAILFHDLGKPYVIKTPEKDGTDRIRFNDHDLVGGKIAWEISRRLKFSAAGALACDPEKIGWLVRRHMFLIHANVKKIRHNTLEKYFFNEKVPSNNLIKLFFVDAWATVPRNGQPDLENFNFLIRRLKKLPKSRRRVQESLPRSLVDGHDVMKTLGLIQSPKVGQLLGTLREEQLAGRLKTKEEALKFLRKFKF